MPRFLRYEWIRESLNKDDEIVDIEHFENFPGEGQGCDIALVRDAEGVNRSWAYIEQGSLPEYFYEAGLEGKNTGKPAAKVPARFRREVSAHKSQYINAGSDGVVQCSAVARNAENPLELTTDGAVVSERNYPPCVNKAAG